MNLSELIYPYSPRNDQSNPILFGQPFSKSWQPFKSQLSQLPPKNWNLRSTSPPKKWTLNYCYNILVTLPKLPGTSYTKILTFQRPMFPSYWNQSVDLLTGFYMMETFVVKRLMPSGDKEKKGKCYQSTTVNIFFSCNFAVNVYPFAIFFGYFRPVFVSFTVTNEISHIHKKH